MRWTHPERRTVSPTCVGLNSLQLCVRYRCILAFLFATPTPVSAGLGRAEKRMEPLPLSRFETGVDLPAGKTAPQCL